MSSYNLGDGGGVFDPEGEPYDPSPQQWVIRPYTDPQTNETYDIVDGYAIVQFEGAPELPTQDPFAYDDPETAPPPVGDPNFDLTDQNVVALTAATGAEVIGGWPGIKGLALRLPPTITVEQAVRTWATQYQGVAAVSPDHLVSNCSNPPNDPWYGFQYFLFEKPYEVLGHDFGTDAESAWGIPAPTRYAQVVEIDSGVVRGHPDLQSNVAAWGINQTQDQRMAVWRLTGGQPWDNLRHPRQSNPPLDLAHGTCVGGIIAATTNNSVGVAGMLGARYNTQLIPIAMNGNIGTDSLIHYDEITSEHAFYDVGVLKGIWAPFRSERNTFSLKAPTVVNYSVGGLQPLPRLETVLNKLAGYVVIIAAAGNHNLPYPDYPARYTSPVLCRPCMGVAAFDRHGMKASYSSYGSQVKMAAPGVEILTTDIAGSEGYNPGYNPDPNGDYCWFGGTSAAAPMVAGVAGYIRGAYPQVTPNELKQALRAYGAYPHDTQYLQASSYVDFFSTLIHFYNIYH